MFLLRRRQIPRRTFLRGIGGVSLALPALEIMQPSVSSAHGGAAPLRYIIAFCGASLGRRDNKYADGGETTDLFVPDEVGAGYTTKRATQPLADHGITDEVSIVSGMRIPYDEGNGVPPGGRRVQFHESTMCPLLTGNAGNSGNDDVVGTTSDQIVGDAIGAGTPHSTLPVCVQAASYRGGSGGTRGTLSYRDGPVAPFVSPRLLFESLFAGFVPPEADPAQRAEAEFQLSRRRNILDLVKADATRLTAELGAFDRQRIEQHFDQLSDLQNRINELEPLPEGSCVLPADPGEDPPIGDSTSTSSSSDYDTSAAWSDEETRALAHTEMLHMALACDLTRSVAFQYTYAHCWLNMFPVTGHTNDLHELGHGGSGSETSPLEAFSDGIAWNIGHWARLVSMLRDTTDFDGRRLLDNTAIVLAFEGGHGYDPEGDDNDVHSTENMALLIAGRAGGLNPTGGKHIVAAGEHPTRVITSAMSAVGAGESLGDIDGVIDDLFT